MNDKKLTTLIRFCDKAFDIELEKLIAPTDKRLKGISVLVYSPTLKAPYWKMVTAGVSEIGNKNPFSKHCGTELVMFVERNTRFYANDDWKYFYNLLIDTALEKAAAKTQIKRGDIVPFEGREGEMKATAVLEPQAVPELLRECVFNNKKSCKFLQIMPITEKEMKLAEKCGFEELERNFYRDGEVYSLDFVAKEHRIE